MYSSETAGRRCDTAIAVSVALRTACDANFGKSVQTKAKLCSKERMLACVYALVTHTNTHTTGHLSVSTLGLLVA